MTSLINKFRKKAGEHFHKNTIQIAGSFNTVSFTFDDAPISAFTTARDILNKYQLKATYYIALSFLESGKAKQYFNKELLASTLSEGHELACHTYNHIRFFDSSHSASAKDLARNAQRFQELFPQYLLQNFSYPFGQQTVSARKLTYGRFTSARGIDPGVNRGQTDLNNLKVVRLYEQLIPLEKQIDFIKNEYKKSGGWLIFYTHDVQENFSDYGCSPQYLEGVIKTCLSAKADIKTVKETLQQLEI